MTDGTLPKPFVFVLMPFTNVFNDIYELGIKGACQEAGAYCERVDEQVFTESILERIYNQIAKCDLVISDMSGRNPNVFYETGYAHALGKQVILLTQDVNDIPFDMKHYPHIIYKKNDISHLKTELIKRVTWLIEHPKQPMGEIDFTLLYYLGGERLIENEEYIIKSLKFQTIDITIFDVNISAHNPTNKTLDLSSIQIGLIGPWITGHRIDVVRDFVAMEKSAKFFSGATLLSSKDNITDLPGDESMYLYNLPPKILPESWINLYCRVAMMKANQTEGESVHCNLRTFSNFGARNLNFKILSDKPTILDAQESKKHEK